MDDPSLRTFSMLYRPMLDVISDQGDDYFPLLFLGNGENSSACSVHPTKGSEY